MSRVLVFSCTHNPFMKAGYVSFLKRVSSRFRCNMAINLGDEVDHHMISDYEKDPDAMGAKEEYLKAIQGLKDLYKAFPKALCCHSNHTSRHTRKGASVGIPSVYFRSLRELLEAPAGWKWADEWEIDGVEYFHGEGFSGEKGHRDAARTRMNSVVMGHLHGIGGVEYIATVKDRVFGMCVGCGIDYKAYAFKYGKAAKLKPIIGCGVVLNGKEAFFIPMDLGKRLLKW